MTVREVLNLLDHEVWVRVRPVGTIRDKPDLVFFSADWHGDAYLPKQLDRYLEWDGDDLSIEMHEDPEEPKSIVPMLVVRAYDQSQGPHVVYVLEKLADYGAGAAAPECRVFLNEERAEAAMRDDYDAEIDARDCAVDEHGSYITSVDARLLLQNGVEIEWAVHARTTEDNDYR